MKRTLPQFISACSFALLLCTGCSNSDSSGSDAGLDGRPLDSAGQADVGANANQDNGADHSVESCAEQLEQCSEDSDCCAGLGCMSGTCLVQAGSPCEEGQECISSVCEDSVCGCSRAKGSYDDPDRSAICSEDSDCCGGLQCTGLVGATYDRACCNRLGEVCAEDTDCCSNRCINQACRCNSTSPYFMCNDDEDCCPGHTCDPLTSLCDPNDDPGCKTLGDPCAAGSECCSGYACQWQTCCVVIDGACDWDSACCSYNCADGICACQIEGGTCREDSNCCGDMTCDKPGGGQGLGSCVK